MESVRFHPRDNRMEQMLVRRVEDAVVGHCLPRDAFHHSAGLKIVEVEIFEYLVLVSRSSILESDRLGALYCRWATSREQHR